MVIVLPASLAGEEAVTESCAKFGLSKLSSDDLNLRRLRGALIEDESLSFRSSLVSSSMLFASTFSLSLTDVFAWLFSRGESLLSDLISEKLKGRVNTL